MHNSKWILVHHEDRGSHKSMMFEDERKALDYAQAVGGTLEYPRQTTMEEGTK